MVLTINLVGSLLIALLALINYCHYHFATKMATPPPSKLEDEKLQSWESFGSYSLIFGHNVFGINHKVPSANTTFVLFHGFPSSSFEFSYGAMDGLIKEGYNVLLHDSIGFGFSDKPKIDFGYSIHDHADVALEYFKMQELEGDCVFVAHDMGNSILTEILARLHRQGQASGLYRITQVVFTNGGMAMEAANLRLSQRILTSRYSEYFNEILVKLDLGWIEAQQLRSVWAPTAGPKVRDHQINLLQTLNRHKGGNAIYYKTIRYLYDRYACEDRWMTALRQLQHSIRIHILWGHADSVAPATIPPLIVSKANLTHTGVKPKYYRDKGHFWQMEDEQGLYWSEAVLNATFN